MDRVDDGIDSTLICVSCLGTDLISMLNMHIFTLG